MLCKHPGQAQQVVCGATEDEQPVYFLQATQLDLAQRAGLLEPTEALFNEPATAATDGIARLACGSAVQVARAAFVVLRHMRGHVKFPHRAHKIPGVVRLVCAHGDAPGAAHLLAVEHQQRGIAFGDIRRHG